MSQTNNDQQQQHAAAAAGDVVPSPPESSSRPPNNDTNDEDDDDSNIKEISVEELLYSSSSYHAIAKPVSLTMILAALAVVYINTEETFEQGQANLNSFYIAWNNEADAEEVNTGKTLGLSVANSLIIVGVIAALTFVIVLLYKYKCIKCLMGYMVLASTALLGVMGGSMFGVAIDKYQLDIDKLSYYWILYNFALVGTFSIFYGRGIPMYVTQGYLIATSVILAWQLSYFDPWTSWTLLVLLALYDLCAVLTPCGPLKALVNLMQQEDSPGMLPGLLYEAELPSEAQRPGRRRRQRRQQEQEQAPSTTTTTGAGEEPSRPTQNVTTAQDDQRNGDDDGNPSSSTTRGTERTTTHPPPTETGHSYRRTTSTRYDMRSSIASSRMNGSTTMNHNGSSSRQGMETTVSHEESSSPTTTVQEQPIPSSTTTPHTDDGRPTAMVPLAIAKLYHLPLVEPVEPIGEETTLAGEETRQYTAAQLCTDVEAIFPRNGGRIDKVVPPSRRRRRRRRQPPPEYIVRDRHGIVKRILVVDKDGKVFEKRSQDDDDDDGPKDNTIKLGLGDFIFYSVLVSKAALYSFTTFAVCMLVILFGLGFTLVLLSVYRHALPALPISILLGVVFYLLTRSVIEPWIQDIFRRGPYYV